MLADLGADVVKVERPGAGDDTRHWGPPFLQDAQGNDTDARHLLHLRSTATSAPSPLTLPSPRGRRSSARWQRRATCWWRTSRSAAWQHYGLDYESLKAINPRLIYCSITGFGQDGPYAERAGYDLMIQAMSGMMSITGRADGEPGGGPAARGCGGDRLVHRRVRRPARSWRRLRRGIARARASTSTWRCWMWAWPCWPTRPRFPEYRQGAAAPGQQPSEPGAVPGLSDQDGAMLLAIGNDGQFAAFARPSGTRVEH